jgi:hypothetical protein
MEIREIIRRESFILQDAAAEALVGGDAEEGEKPVVLV